MPKKAPPAEKVPKPPKKALTLSLPDGAYERLDEMALEMGFRWGTRGNPSALVAAIALGDLAPVALDRGTMHALQRAVTALADLDLGEEARAVLALLERHGTVPPEVRLQVMQQFGQAETPLRKQLEDFIARKQPFVLDYMNGVGQTQRLTVLYACIRAQERRSYLEIRTKESTGNREIGPLSHNWVLRLDRVAALEPVGLVGAGAAESGAIDDLEALMSMPVAAEEAWAGELEHVVAILRMTGALARSYQLRADEDLGTEITFDSRTKRTERLVKRRVTSSFWFLRDVLRFGGECVIEGPQELRALVAREAGRMAKAYS